MAKRFGRKIRRRVSRWRARRRAGRRTLTIPIARTMGVAATGLAFASRAIGGQGGQDVIGPFKAGDFGGGIGRLAQNMQAATQPAVIFPIIFPALITGATGMALDFLKANPTIKVGRFKVKAV